MNNHCIAIRNTDDADQADFHGSVGIRVIRAIRVLKFFS